MKFVQKLEYFKYFGVSIDIVGNINKSLILGHVSAPDERHRYPWNYSAGQQHYILRENKDPLAKLTSCNTGRALQRVITLGLLMWENCILHKPTEKFIILFNFWYQKQTDISKFRLGLTNIDSLIQSNLLFFNLLLRESIFFQNSDILSFQEYIQYI